MGMDLIMVPTNTLIPFRIEMVRSGRRTRNVRSADRLEPITGK